MELTYPNIFIQNYMKYKHKDCIFIIKKSKICDGLGLFAKENIKKGTYITWYHGYTIRKFKVSSKNKYMIDYKSVKYKNSEMVLVGIKNLKKLIMKGVAQLANDSICWDLTNKTNNSEFIQIGKYVFLKSILEINKNEEILVSYGTKYWISQIHNFPNEYNNKFRFVLKIINHLIIIIEKNIKTEIYEYLGIFDNIIKFNTIEKNRWCIYSADYHEDNKFYFILKKDNDRINVYYKCLTCLSDNIFIESIYS